MFTNGRRMHINRKQTDLHLRTPYNSGRLGFIRTIGIHCIQIAGTYKGCPESKFITGIENRKNS